MKFYVYKDKTGEWRWRLVSKNKRIICDSGEGFKTRAGAKKNIERVKNQAAYAEVV